MVKFSREFEAQLIPEWKDAFVNYRQLKKHVKKIKISLYSQQRSETVAAAAAGNDVSSFGFSIFDAFRSVSAIVFSGSKCGQPDFTVSADDEDSTEESEPTKSREDEEKEFLDKVESELEKVNRFYEAREREFCERGEALTKQLHTLADLKKILEEHRRCCRQRRSFSGDPASSPAFSGEAIAVQPKTKKGAKLKATALTIDIPATTPGKTISAIAAALVWENLVNGDEDDGRDYISRKKIQCAEKMIRRAFIELYRGLGLLKNYCSLNMIAFIKILKKYDKALMRPPSCDYLQKVKRSYFISSDKVVKLVDEVESIFIKYFAGNNRKSAMKFLRPDQPKESHKITFFVGLFTGSFVALFTVYAILAHISGIFSSAFELGYMEIVYPVFSVFALLSLHIFLYGCNLFMWKRCRINNNFIFEFNPNSALHYRDAFLICTSIMTLAVGSMVVHLILAASPTSSHRHHLVYANAIPGSLLAILLGTLVFPFNIFYRPTRYCFLRIMRNILFSPLYKVLMADFFMADQLTSQIPMLRHLEFTACYLVADKFGMRPYETCTRNTASKILIYVISFLPYYCRAVQCLRRYVEEGYDRNHLVNAGKYVSAMVAAAARWKYAMEPENPAWLAAVVVTSALATAYQLYWDLVKDWGLLDIRSSNPLLRDDLILPNWRCIYYASMGLNLVLRLAWIESVLRLNVGPMEYRMLDFLLASLEIIRRGHWNFYRVENEHLNNVGKYRAVKTVPLPFKTIDD